MWRARLKVRAEEYQTRQRIKENLAWWVSTLKCRQNTSRFAFNAVNQPYIIFGSFFTPAIKSAWHSPLHTGLAKSRRKQRPSPLHQGPEDREELDDSMLAECLFNQIDGHTPPGKNRADDPEVRGDFHSCSNAAAECEQAAGYC